MANEPQKIEYLQFETENGSTSNLFRIPHTYEDVGAAPGGYGLGGAKYISASEIDSTTRPGWYCCKENYIVDGFTNSRWWIFVKAFGDGSFFATQELYTFYGSNVYKLERHRLQGNDWSPFEWVNPPMDVGKEYRTTERINGSPVYTTLLDCGTTQKIENGVGSLNAIIRGYNPNRIIRQSPYTYYSIPYINSLTTLGDSWTIVSNVARRVENNIAVGFEVSIRYGYNRSNTTVYNQVWYAK